MSATEKKRGVGGQGYRSDQHLPQSSTLRRAINWPISAPNQPSERHLFSVILYGRNDSHGYNLHKRAAISFNALAEVMSDPDDEILFVDYNTPDDHPTFPEAIHDTLTDKAKKVMRILRVRPDQHVRHRLKHPPGGARAAIA